MSAVEERRFLMVRINDYRGSVRIEEAKEFALQHVPAGSALHEGPERNVRLGATEVVFAHESFEPVTRGEPMPVKAVNWDENWARKGSLTD